MTLQETGSISHPADTTSKPWLKYICSSETRSPRPLDIWSASGHCETSLQQQDDIMIVLREGSMITLDFEVEVGGHLTFDISCQPPHPSPIALSFSESPLFVGPNSDDTGAVPTMDYDKAYAIDLRCAQPVAGREDGPLVEGWMSHRMPEEKLRGGFRFATFKSISSSVVTVKNVQCQISFAPHQSNLRDYSGFFHCSDHTLNRIWYAGAETIAYTVQTNIIPNNTGRYLPQVASGWNYSAPLGEGSPILVDGAKRDRAIWPGDMGISIPSCLVAFGTNNGWPAVKNALQTVFHHQHNDGQLIFAGPSTMSFRNGARSLTYHFWSLVACVDLFHWGGEQAEFVMSNWTRILEALEFSMSLIHPNNLVEQTQLNDWGRDGSGGYNAALNALAYRSLSGMGDIAQIVDPRRAGAYKLAARQMQQSFNDILWDDQAGLYRDNPDSLIHPQDGNALALSYMLAPPDRAKLVSCNLSKNWNSIGPVCPELADTISPFISSIEVNAHFAAGQPDRAIELMHRTWGYMLDAPQMTGSTLVEGMTADGSLSYRAHAGYNHDPSYTSMSHSWSSGPTSSLMYHLVGLTVSCGGGRDYSQKWCLRPQPGRSGIKHARGGIETFRGRFEASWRVDERRGEWLSDVIVPMDCTGKIHVPDAYGKVTAVELDGRIIIVERGENEHVVIEVESGGSHHIKAHFSPHPEETVS